MTTMASFMVKLALLFAFIYDTISLDDDEILRRFVELEQKESELQATVSTLKKTVQAQQDRMEAQKLASEIKDKTIKQLDTRVRALEKDMGSDRQPILRVFENEGRSRRLLDPTQDSSVHVAFQAASTHGETSLSINDVVSFDKVNLNIGNGYHSPHGLFIAPVAGIYLFSASITSGSGNVSHEFDACIARNGDCLARILGHGDNARNDQGSSTVVVSLESQDEVYIKHVWPANAVLRGGYFTSFTGLLVFQI